uniref:Uncharacterized protein n=1 Tax=Anguilla anguilla TaxID=7936 RepID=A0A0E9QDV9_ANGAN
MSECGADTSVYLCLTFLRMWKTLLKMQACFDSRM